MRMRQTREALRTKAPSLWLSLIFALATHSPYAFSNTNGTCIWITDPNAVDAPIEVSRSTDAGAYYCEHTLCFNLKEATDLESIGRNSDNEPLLGFLHVAPDQFLLERPGIYTQSERQAANRRVLAAGIQGYVLDLLEHSAGKSEFKILITGFGPFMGNVQYPDGSIHQHEFNNPTQELVTIHENFDAAMEHSFGSSQTPAYRQGITSNYVVQHGGRTVLISLIGQYLDTNDSVFGTLRQSLKENQPNAVISTGVGPNFSAESRASNAGLRGIETDTPAHEEGLAPTFELFNESLWKALQRGSNSKKPPLP